ncbi:hypothetical protein P7L79_05340 (plasmid) [Tistrella mobilis]|uniref:hypothetical protein n=1 Tax=Tistrella mobilis TaxID=171437 RepID=UPI0035591C78
MKNFQGKGQRPTAPCKRCGAVALLCRSHAINDAFFKGIFRENSGKAHHLAIGAEKPVTTSESGWDYLLCEACEAHLNNNLDRWGHRWFKDAQDKIARDGWRGKFEIDPTRMARYVASVMWRASVSKAGAYEGFITNPTLRGQLKAVMDDQESPLEDFSVAINLLYDSEGQFSASALRRIILSPISWIKRGGQIDRFVISMTVEGFLVVASYPKFPWRNRLSSGFLNAQKSYIFMRPSDIRKTAPFPDLLEDVMRQLAG